MISLLISLSALVSRIAVYKAYVKKEFQCKTVAVAEDESSDLSDDSKDDSDNSLMSVQEKHSSPSLDLASTSSSTKVITMIYYNFTIIIIIIRHSYY